MDADAHRFVSFCGPATVTRLSFTSKSWWLSLPPEQVLRACKLVPLMGVSNRYPLSQCRALDPEALSKVSEVTADLKVDSRFMVGLCAACDPLVDQLQKDEGRDALFSLVALGEDSGSAAVWARALRRRGLVALLTKPETSGLDAVSSEALGDKCFEAIQKGQLPTVIRCLAANVSLAEVGPKIHGIDQGCCQFSLLGAAAFVSGRTSYASLSLLLTAKALADQTLNGPCGWTPLMLAARQGPNAAEACKLLVLSGADVKPRLRCNGETALDMADKVCKKAITDAREARNSRLAAAQEEQELKAAQKSSKGGQGGRGVPQALLSMSFGKKGNSGRGRGGAGRGSGYK